jgi:threonine aldolase
VNFQSDNTSTVAPQVIEAILNANHESVPSYGKDAVTEDARAKFEQVFERPVDVFFVSTGTAANGLSLASSCPPYGAIFAHENAHVITDEANAIECFTGGAKIVGIPGNHGKIDPLLFERRIQIWKNSRPHAPLPSVITLTQATEAGTVYTIKEIQALSEIARAHNMLVHMDGARFANAVVALGESPAALSWKAGVDILSFGGTKNGALMAEAVVFFNRDLARQADYTQKRMGQLSSKMRFLSAQFLALFYEDLWLRHAYHANRTATQVAEVLQRCEGVRLLYPVDINEVFVEMPPALVSQLRAKGISFYEWGMPGHHHYRFVTSFNTHLSAIDGLKVACQSYVETEYSQKAIADSL